MSLTERGERARVVVGARGRVGEQHGAVRAPLAPALLRRALPQPHHQHYIIIHGYRANRFTLQIQLKIELL